MSEETSTEAADTEENPTVEAAPAAAGTETVARGHRKVRVGQVVSTRMDKTIAVRVERRIRHPLYGKEMKASKKLYAHDEDQVAVVGDRVRVMETRPISKTKRWRLVEVVQRQD